MADHKDNLDDFKNVSGIFLTVWNDDEHIWSNILKPTMGGPSHITVAYTAQLVPIHKLALLGAAFAIRMSKQPIEIVDVKVNSFNWEKKGRTRHDVLMILSKKDTAIIEEMRHTIRNTFPTLHKKFGMNEPHITHLADAHSIEHAKHVCAGIKKILPLKVQCTGFNFKQ